MKEILLFVFSVGILFAGDPSPLTTLDSYLAQNGFNLSPANTRTNEGYSTEKQRNTFKKDCQSIPRLKKVLEIGFNGGHSCEAFLNSGSEITVTSFDINKHPYTQTGVDFMSQKYPDRFQFIPGDSADTINAYAADHPGEKFDLIFIDGCHEHSAAVKDIENCRKLAHEETVVWIDDYVSWGAKTAIDQCAKEGLIKILEVKSEWEPLEDPLRIKISQGKSGYNPALRAWVIAKYL